VFQQLRLRGKAGAVLWGYRTAASLGGWTITQQQAKKGEPKRWTLVGTVERLDPFQARQRPLLFTAHRDKGMWAWPIVELQEAGPIRIRAILGAPEQ